MHIETLSSTDIFTGRVFSLRRDRLRYPDGRQTDYDLVVHPGAVAILPLDSQQRLWFVNQYRHAAAQELLELPAGTLDPQESPHACAARELREEIGFAAAELRLIGSFYLAPGYSSEYMHVFLASGLSPDPLPLDPDEFLQPVAYPLPEVWQMLARGAFQDAKTIACLCLARPHLTSTG